MKNIMVTGGAGFIGSALVRHIINHCDDNVCNVDKLTYAGNLESLESIAESDRYQFIQADICDETHIREIIQKFRPDIVIHLAAESHVDRSIDGPAEFMKTNVIGTFVLLDAVRDYWFGLPEASKKAFRFHHVSTDEVYGDLGFCDAMFTEETPYAPSSPYSASKASSDHLVRAWNKTFGLPIVITNCSNNYGPYHFPEKLIPLVILNAIECKKLPIYGDGSQIRDWLYVEDHARALYQVATRGVSGETYNIGGHNEKTNLDVVKTICSILDELLPVNDTESNIKNYQDLIVFVKDRPGHDLRYAIDASKIENELGWIPEESFETGIRKTVQWYLDNQVWSQRVQDGSYQRERLGKGV